MMKVVITRTNLPKVIWEEGRVTANVSQGVASASMHNRSWAMCAMAFIHECACYAHNLAACICFVIEQTLLFLLISHKPQFWSWNWTYRQKATNRAFQWCVCRTEMLSSFHIRIGNISPSATQWHFALWKWGTKTPKPPLPLAWRRPHLVQQCLGPLHAPPQTAAPTVEALLHTCSMKLPLVTMARPKFAPKSTPSRGLIPELHYLPHPWTCPTYEAKRHPDAMRSFSTMQRPMHQQTDRSSTGKFDDYYY